MLLFEQSNFKIKLVLKFPTLIIHIQFKNNNLTNLRRLKNQFVVLVSYSMYCQRNKKKEYPAGQFQYPARYRIAGKTAGYPVQPYPYESHKGNNELSTCFNPSPRTDDESTSASPLDIGALPTANLRKSRKELEEEEREKMQ